MTTNSPIDALNTIAQQIPLQKTRLQRVQSLEMAEKILTENTGNYRVVNWIWGVDLNLLKSKVAQIHNVVHSVLGLPSDCLKIIASFLSNTELKAFSKVSTKTRDITRPMFKDRFVEKAQKYGYRGTDFEQAQQSLQKLEKQWLSITEGSPRQGGKPNVYRELEKYTEMRAWAAVSMLSDARVEHGIPQMKRVYECFFKFVEDGRFGPCTADIKSLVQLTMRAASEEGAWDIVKLTMNYSGPLSEVLIRDVLVAATNAGQTEIVKLLVQKLATSQRE